ncbi:hypothetical protein EJ08DRAFT_699229 [Tothia fuscella]|uniref:Uncharacterized protein n=1 Tax=Tothia fuscella TaxID=1048955 RepID=A0A9P4TX13_9PEZI|nr:hypothetical protein EJ08DRAFT_699229 [Tothia fuscella]
MRISALYIDGGTQGYADEATCCDRCGLLGLLPPLTAREAGAAYATLPLPSTPSPPSTPPSTTSFPHAPQDLPAADDPDLGVELLRRYRSTAARGLERF